MITIDLDLADSIKDVKAKIEKVLKISPQRQSLYFEGTELTEANTAAGALPRHALPWNLHGVKPGATLEVKIR